MRNWVLTVLCWMSALCLPVQAQTVTYIHTDALGSPAVETDANRNVIERNEYEPYGRSNQPLDDAPAYTGHVGDAATGLIYAQQRYYDEDIGLFLSVDPVTAYDSPVGQFNRYRYGNSNPYRYTDPDGRCVMPGNDYCGKSMEVIQAQEAARPRPNTNERGWGWTLFRLAVDFTPILGDRVAAYEARSDPSIVNIASATLGLMGPLGDFAGKVLKRGGGIVEKIPSDWIAAPNKKGVGLRWQDPGNKGNGVRIDQGNPSHSLPSQQVDHVVIRSNGRVIGRDGRPISGSIKDNAEASHIPLSEYQNWSSWDSP